MSFDPITLAMAKPKVIDLDKYGIGEVISALFASGGGEQIIQVGNFFGDVSTDRVLRLEMEAYGAHFAIDQCVRSIAEGEVVQIGFSFMTFYDGIYNINVAIVKVVDSRAQVYVTVT